MGRGRTWSALSKVHQQDDQCLVEQGPRLLPAQMPTAPASYNTEPHPSLPTDHAQSRAASRSLSSQRVASLPSSTESEAELLKMLLGGTHSSHARLHLLLPSRFVRSTLVDR